MAKNKNRMEVVTKDTEFQPGDIILTQGNAFYFSTAKKWRSSSGAWSELTEYLFRHYADNGPIFRIFKAPRPKVDKVKKEKVEVETTPKFPVEINGFYIDPEDNSGTGIRVRRGNTFVRLTKSEMTNKANKIFIRSNTAMTVGAIGTYYCFDSSRP